jgi:DnaJ like chaperone protein
MSIWGKVLGGVGGFAIGGPLGAIIGAVAGHAVDRMRNAKTQNSDATKSIAFTIGVIVLGAKMAKADGRVTKDEVEAFRQVFHVPPEEMKNVARVFDMAKKDASGFEPYARQVARLFETNKTVLEDLLGGLFHIAQADNVIHPAELDYLRRVAGIFGFDDLAFERIKSSYLGPSDADPYSILGVPHDISDDELKSAYRKLVRENHPDKAIADGLPPEFIDVANEKLSAINDAYDRIARARGIG